MDIEDEKLFPQAVYYAMEEADMAFSEADFVLSEEDSIRLYRGESREVLDTLRDEEGGLESDSPIYFTNSVERSRWFAQDRYSESESVILEIRAPFEALEITPNYISDDDLDRGNYDSFMDPEKLYFSHTDFGSQNWVGKKIPDDWIYSINGV